MATTKKSTTTTKKTSKPKTAASSAKKGTASSKNSTSARRVKTVPVDSQEEKFAEQALKFVDQAAGLLRDGIRTGATQTAKVRASTRKQAQGLLTKASSQLEKALQGGTSALRKIIG